MPRAIIVEHDFRRAYELAVEAGGGDAADGLWHRLDLALGRQILGPYRDAFNEIAADLLNCALSRLAVGTADAFWERLLQLRRRHLAGSYCNDHAPGATYDARVTFYRRVSDDRFEATPYTRGPWDAGSQHAGPPAALLGRAVEQHPQRENMRVARLTFDIIRPVPISVLAVSTRLVRAGRSVAVIEAELTPDGGPVAMRATALLIRAAGGVVPAVPDEATPGCPDTAEAGAFFPVPYEVGYHTAMEYRFTAGSFLSPGPATCWMRMRIPLVDEEEPSPLARVLCAADSGNGISSVLDWRRYLFINPELTVHLGRYPLGEWVCLDARTSIDPDGIGLTQSSLYDQHGAIGRAAQSLLVAPR